MDKKTGAGLLAARLGVGAIFLVSGLGKLAAWNATTAWVAGAGVTPLLLAGATALEIGGALSLLLGWKTRVGAVALVAFLVPVTLVFHAFWGAPAAEAQLQTIQFLKNVSIGGGLIAVLTAGPGAFSLDGLRARGRAPRAAAPDPTLREAA
jgi:putative oxidoreductase